jgi:hypothetical protein
MNVYKDKYWPYIELPSGVNEVMLAPEAWIEVNVQRDGNYPAQSILALFTVSENGRSGDSFVSQLPDDTTIMIRAFGDEQNKLGWQLNDGANQVFHEGEMNGLFVSKFDTLYEVVLRY